MSCSGVRQDRWMQDIVKLWSERYGVLARHRVMSRNDAAQHAFDDVSTQLLRTIR
jgi:hypothetical protein